MNKKKLDKINIFKKEFTYEHCARASNLLQKSFLKDFAAGAFLTQ